MRELNIAHYLSRKIEVYCRSFPKLINECWIAEDAFLLHWTIEVNCRSLPRLFNEYWLSVEALQLWTNSVVKNRLCCILSNNRLCPTVALHWAKQQLC